MACDSRAGLEAQKLISISLGKMAASRVGRTGTSLHKSLLVASVLHRARHVFLEESYNVHRATQEAYAVHQPPPPPPVSTPPPTPVVAVYTPLLPPPPPPAEEPSEADDKENRACEPTEEALQVAEGSRQPLGESNSKTRRSSGSSSLKRRRCVSQQETQEAVWSILPKRPRSAPDSSSSSAPEHTEDDDEEPSGNMEVEHITSLVSIFSFGGQRVDLCSAQAARDDLNQYQPVALAV